jgi:hypothetical protein
MSSAELFDRWCSLPRRYLEWCSGGWDAETNSGSIFYEVRTVEFSSLIWRSWPQRDFVGFNALYNRRILSAVYFMQSWHAFDYLFRWLFTVHLLYKAMVYLLLSWLCQLIVISLRFICFISISSKQSLPRFCWENQRFCCFDLPVFVRSSWYGQFAWHATPETSQQRQVG